MAYKYPTAVLGKTVRVHYVGTFDDKQEFDNSYNRKSPITFTLGQGQIINGFEKAVIGMTPGDKKNISLTPPEAYGDIKNNLFQTFERSNFPEDFELTLGELISVPAQDGKVYPAFIEEVSDESVVLNFNHPMAGKSLNFEIELVEIVKDGVDGEGSENEESEAGKD